MSSESTSAAVKDAAKARPAVAPPFLLGMGLGGFVDGILLHQLFQWHHMLTHTGSMRAATCSGWGRGGHAPRCPQHPECFPRGHPPTGGP
ncbi:MAG TPA: DUF2243 domain-containing protein [Arthrobacter sp.]|nr:DUF2243 domain-containing protein [Arthrobacter sp.]